jgi:hypothetical protein
MGKKALLLPMVFTLLISSVVLAATPVPTDLKMVEPDPSLPKELVAFLGRWEQISVKCSIGELIVERIDEEKASLYLFSSGSWIRRGAKVSKEHGKYKLWYSGNMGVHEYSLKEDGSLRLSYGGNRPGFCTYKRVP